MNGDNTLRKRLIRLAYTNPQVQAALKEAGILDKLFKRYKEDHPNSKTPPQSLRDKAKEMEQGQKKTENSNSSDKRFSWSDTSLPDVSNVTKMNDKDLAQAIKDYEGVKSKAKAKYDDITKNSVTHNIKKTERKEWHKKVKPIEDGLRKLEDEKRSRIFKKKK